MFRAIENGAWNPSLSGRLGDLEARKADLQRQLQAARNPTPCVRLTHDAAVIYRTKVGDLEASLNAPDIRLEAAEALRSLIERVVLTPEASSPDGLAAELHGALATILALAAAAPERGSSKRGRSAGVARGTSVPMSQLSVVAGTGFEPVTFRL